MTSHRPDDDGHPHGLQYDLANLARQAHLRKLQERRQALLWLAAGGAAAALAACGDGSDGTSGSSTSSSSSTSATAATSTVSSDSGSCVADPQETNGPYPSDGSNTVNGAVSDILTTSGIVRSNIRSSFGTSTTTAAGVPLVLTLNLVNVGSSCSALSDYAIYIWHCNCEGEYSLYATDIQNENYLRGVQVTDGNGQVTFETIFPACYSGRYPHIHFEIYRSLSVATAYTNAILTAQMAMPSAICSAVYEGSSLYGSSVAEFANVATSTDLVFASSTAAELAAQTPSLTGSVADGFTGTITIGVSA
jgi:protocatechuate 3,4-dioxygenase beta subunit